MSQNKKKRTSIYPTASKKKVSRAAEKIRNSLTNGSPIPLDEEQIVENWRASHVHILNSWQATLRNRIGGKDIVFAQRLKRRNTIYDKLKRQPKMVFTRMHDIAGCRLIFKNEEDLHSYRNELHNAKKLSHKLKKEQSKDYIVKPKESGYRGIHDIYEYNSRKGKDRSPHWNGLLVEIQYRTACQHAWATAVEVADNIMKGRAKFSEGDEKLQEFFRLTSEIIARAHENKKSCKSYLTNEELLDQFFSIEKETSLLRQLENLKTIQKEFSGVNVIIQLKSDPQKPTSEIFVYESLSEANIEYFKKEKEFPDDDIVLVRGGDSKVNKTIQDAFRNYFADTTDFVDYIKEGLKKLGRSGKWSA